ncbi:MAG: hypothetical protein LQ340_000960 [Diploschistes diacapsis]|nr:MAG: hypothetical protein LQ340_000960 [Diploschistes diacapsis]
MVGYQVADANSYITITGYGIDDVRIVKKSFVWPFQKASRISISPFDFSITLQAMTREKLSFCLPAVFTIGPNNEPESLRKYALLLTGNEDGTPAASKSHKATGRNHVQEIVKGIIEGETRVIVSTMSMEEIFRERDVFKSKIIESVQVELNQFGLKIYNANVKELQDTPGSEYFQFLSRKAHEGASNQAKIDVANARMLGEIGEAEKKSRARQEISKIDAQTAVLETQRKSEKAKADAELATTQTQLDMNIKLAQIQALRGAEVKDNELQRDVETKRADMELERQRASDVVKAKINREVKAQAAEAALYTDSRKAEADYIRAAKEADAAYYAKKKEAEALSAMAKAYGEMAEVLGGPQGLLQYMMIQNGTYEKLAETNAKAVSGMQPKISVWSNGNSGEGMGGGMGGMGDAMAPIRNLYQSLPPVLQTVEEQTGIRPPAWLAQMPEQGYQIQEVMDPKVKRRVNRESALSTRSG